MGPTCFPGGKSPLWSRGTGFLRSCKAPRTAGYGTAPLHLRNAWPTPVPPEGQDLHLQLWERWPKKESHTTRSSWPWLVRTNGVFSDVHNKVCFQAHGRVSGPPHVSLISLDTCLPIRPISMLWLTQQDKKNHKVQKTTGDWVTYPCPL